MMQRRQLLALLLTSTLVAGAFSTFPTSNANAATTAAVQQTGSHQVQIGVNSTGSPWKPVKYSGPTVTVKLEFALEGEPATHTLEVPLPEGKTPIELAEDIRDAINKDKKLKAAGYSASSEDGTVFVDGPLAERCQGTADKPVLSGDANKVQTITQVKKLK